MRDGPRAGGRAPVDGSRSTTRRLRPDPGFRRRRHRAPRPRARATRSAADRGRHRDDLPARRGRVGRRRGGAGTHWAAAEPRVPESVVRHHRGVPVGGGPVGRGGRMDLRPGQAAPVLHREAGGRRRGRGDPLRERGRSARRGGAAGRYPAGPAGRGVLGGADRGSRPCRRDRAPCGADRRGARRAAVERPAAGQRRRPRPHRCAHRHDDGREHRHPDGGHDPDRAPPQHPVRAVPARFPDGGAVPRRFPRSAESDVRGLPPEQRRGVRRRTPTWRPPGPPPIAG